MLIRPIKPSKDGGGPHGCQDPSGATYQQVSSVEEEGGYLEATRVCNAQFTSSEIALGQGARVEMGTPATVAAEEVTTKVSKNLKFDFGENDLK
jgi:hypothetical protein